MTFATTLAAGSKAVFTFRLFDAETGGTELWYETTPVKLAVSASRSVRWTLGSAVPFSNGLAGPVDFSQQLWVQITAGRKTFKRVKLPVVPYALWSDAGGSGGTITSVNAGAGLSGGGNAGEVTLSADTAVIQQRVTGECAAGNAIRRIDADGAVACEPLAAGSGDITGVDAGTGLTGGGNTGTVVINADIGTGAGQVAAGDHTHGAIYYSKTEVDALLATRDSAIATLQAQVAALNSLLQHFSRVGDEITIEGANLNIVSGSGSTGGAVNGLGNLVIGYNEGRGGGDVRTGSHNLVIGTRNNFSSYGGLVAGSQNSISGQYASVTGGFGNTASGNYASVSGGSSNSASGNNSSVSGGSSNTASGGNASVSGGATNVASGTTASVSAGNRNTASGTSSSVSGGSYNTASGSYSAVVGGGSISPVLGNKAYGNYSAVLGGENNAAGDTQSATPDATIGEFSAVSGGLNNTARGDHSSVSGGWANKASGDYSSVSGGELREVTGAGDWRAGGLFQDN